MRGGFSIGVVLCGVVLMSACRQGESQGESKTGGAREADEPAEQQHDPLSANAGCYVCHMTFVHEELAATHFKAEVNCISCHGTSAAHANDEDIGATPPDIIIKGDQIDPSCRK